MSLRLKKTLITLVQFGISAAIIGYLIYDARHNQMFAQLVNDPKDWGLLSLAALLILASILTTFVRWYLLARALDLPFRIKDAFRLGFVGYLYNFVSLGSVGGDVFKAIFVSREQPGRRAEAVATVVVDRVVGLYAVFVLATISILLTGLHKSDIPEVRVICNATFISVVVGAIGFAMLLIPGLTSGAVSQSLERLPRIGPTLGKLIHAVRMYRKRVHILVIVLVMTLGSHSLSTVGIYLIARGLPGNAPDLGGHFVVVPLAMVAGALPLPLNGLGAFEGVIEFLYTRLPGETVAKGQGLLVSLAYRVITILVAILSAIVYTWSRREVAQAMRQAQAEAAASESSSSAPLPVTE